MPLIGILDEWSCRSEGDKTLYESFGVQCQPHCCFPAQPMTCQDYAFGVDGVLPDHIGILALNIAPGCVAVIPHISAFPQHLAGLRGGNDPAFRGSRLPELQ